MDLKHIFMESQIPVEKQNFIFVLGMKHAILTKRQILIRLSQMGENLVE
jgi:hypothetical protein